MGLEELFGKDASVLRDTSFQVLLFANVLGPLGSSLLSPLLDSLIDPFGASEATIALLMSVFTAPAIVMIPLAGVLMDRYGRKPILFVCLPLFSLSGVAIAFTTDFRVALALRFLQGIGFAGINPVIITSIGDLYEGGAEATAQGFRFTGSGLTQTFFPLLAGVLVVSAWQFPFLLYGIGLPAALAVYLWLDEPLDAAAESAGAAVGDGGRADGAQIGRLARLARAPRVVAMVIARGTPVVAWIGFLTYNSILVVRVLGGTPPQAGLLAAVGGLTYAAAASQAGRLTDFFERRLPSLVVANVGLGAGLGIASFAPSLPVAVAGITLMGLGFGVTMSLYRSIVTGLAPPDLRGGIVSFAESFGRITATLTPIAMGLTIGALTPVVGFTAAVRWTCLATGVVAGGGGIVCLLVANVAPEPILPERAA